MADVFRKKNTTNNKTLLLSAKAANKDDLQEDKYWIYLVSPGRLKHDPSVCQNDGVWDSTTRCSLFWYNITRVWVFIGPNYVASPFVFEERCFAVSTIYTVPRITYTQMYNYNNNNNMGYPKFYARTMNYGILRVQIKLKMNFRTRFF